MIRTCSKLAGDPLWFRPICPDSVAPESLPEPRISGERAGIVFVSVKCGAGPGVVVEVVIALVTAVVTTSVVTTTGVQRPCFGVLCGSDGEECQRRGHGDRQLLHPVLPIHRLLLI